MVVVAVMAFVMVPLALLSNVSSAEAQQPSHHVTAVLPSDIQIPDLPTVTVILPGQTVTIKVPGQPVTDIITVPGQTVTKTVRIPLPQDTVTVVGPTQTVTNNSAGPTATVTKTGPTQTITVETTPDAVDTGQGGTTGGTIEPDDDGTKLPEFINEPVEIVGYGLLTILALAGLIVLGLWGGYVLGYKDRQVAEARFLRALRDQIMVNRK